METREITVNVPEGFEIDKENSTFEHIRFKPISENITYTDVCDSIFSEDTYYINSCGEIQSVVSAGSEDVNNASNAKQLRKILALNQLINIAEYYNRLHTIIDNKQYSILYYKRTEPRYIVKTISSCYNFSVRAVFNREEDAQSVISNPNFREILNTIYKD